MPAVSFNYAAWQARYPEFATVTEPVADAYFAEAGLYLDNTGAGPVQDAGQQLLLMNMITAHLAALYSGVNGAAPSGLVGRVSKASQGSVSVDTDYGTQSASAAFWLQTPYGASYWQATNIYRRFQYVPGPRPVNYGVSGYAFDPRFRR